ncbi:MAG: Rhodanese-like protein [Rhodoferax sp.]|nr:Rhodanese-like protein [Rhodoferax sp.]
MTPSIRALCSVFCLLLFGQVQAMTLEKQDTALFATGPLGGDDWLKFKQAFTDPDLRTIVLVNSPGGNLWDGLAISRLISEKGYDTVLAGYCNSACALLFMGGRERRFSSAFAPSATYIGIHGASSSDNGSLAVQTNPEVYALLKKAMGAKFNPDIVNTALYKMDDRHALLVIPDSVRTPLALAFHCKDGQTAWANCLQFKDATALNLGVTTHNDMVTVALPAAFRPATTLLGRPQTAAVADPASFLDQLARQHCADDRCKAGVAAFEALDGSKALAVPEDATGVTWSARQASLGHAVLASVYACNHVDQGPVHLCPAAMADGFDLGQFYTDAEAGHRAALAQLQRPPERHYGREQYGGGFVNAKAYRFQQLLDVPPMEIDGVQTIDTQALAQLLMSGTAPRLIDIGGTEVTIPTASTIFFGGMAFEDPALETAFNARFTGLLKLLAPGAERPLVVFGAGRQWVSVNAALRARRAGYTHVLWYRGGLEAWTSASLPVAPTTVRAVAN